MAVLHAQMGGALPSGAPGVFAMQTCFSKARLLWILSKWGHGALRVYLGLMWVDFIYALAYGFFLASLLGLLLKVEGKPARWKFVLLSLPLLASFLDWTENLLHILLLPEIQRLPEVVVFLMALLSSAKWCFALTAIAAVLFLLVYKAFYPEL